jgi:hypothetical protein
MMNDHAPQLVRVTTADATPAESDVLFELALILYAKQNLEEALELIPVKLAERGPHRVFGAGIIAGNREAAGDTLEGVVKLGDRIAVVGYIYARAEGLLLAGTTASPVVVSNDPALLAS